MNVAMIGVGYVGLVSGACFSEFGHTVKCVDADIHKIDALLKGEIPIYEPGLEELVRKNCARKHLYFLSDLSAAIQDADIIFIAVGTPSRRGGGHADLSYVFRAVEEVVSALQHSAVIVIKSTVPVGTAAQVQELANSLAPNLAIDIVANPEFLREGSAIEDFMRPDRIVVGVDSEAAADKMRALYRPHYLNETPLVITNTQSAELIKYAANAYLATRVTFINEIAELCEKSGANVQVVARGMGLDGRIGSKFLHAGPGYGGSCFPKDTRALVQTAKDYGVSLSVVEAAAQSNDLRKISMAEKIVTACGGSVQGKTLAILGLAFKPNTDDIRESPSLEIIPILQAQGCEIRAFDPKAQTAAQQALSDVTWGEDAYDTLSGADAMVIVTEWNEFRALDLNRVRTLLNSPVVIDLRNIYEPEEMRKHQFSYFSIGREAVIFADVLDEQKKCA